MIRTSRWSLSLLFGAGLTVLTCAVACTSIFAAQAAKKGAAGAKQPPAAKQRATDDDEPSPNPTSKTADSKTGKAADDGKPRELSLDTKDGVRLNAVYYPARPVKQEPARGKETVPVILVHMHKGSSADYKSLAETLSAAGHAVVVPDLRGHGASTRVERNGRTKKIDQSTLIKADYEAMINDLEAVKSFLLSEHNAGKLNIRKLCVVGAEMGAVVALNWAALDWSWPPLVTGPQGQDVRALVLITPQWGFKGLTIKNATAHVNLLKSASVMIIAGAKDTANLDDARRLNQLFEKYHELPPPDAPLAVRQEKQDLFFITPATTLVGTKLLNEKSLRIEDVIANFIKFRILQNENLDEWATRTKSLN
jgi:alpha-beta hydrolase superfamily lysophospholipase